MRTPANPINKMVAYLRKHCIQVVHVERATDNFDYLCPKAMPEKKEEQQSIKHKPVLKPKLLERNSAFVHTGKGLQDAKPSSSPPPAPASGRIRAVDLDDADEVEALRERGWRRL